MRAAGRRGWPKHIKRHIFPVANAYLLAAVAQVLGGRSEQSNNASCYTFYFRQLLHSSKYLVSVGVGVCKLVRNARSNKRRRNGVFISVGAAAAAAAAGAAAAAADAGKATTVLRQKTARTDIYRTL